ncbi:thiaminase II [Streptacidiphilus sp. MAP5-3]|uniref:thiaminase II n=1 Tax=unclassified Streptacidiphilus TaxID=2643834 RepID=UPI0035185F08
MSLRRFTDDLWSDIEPIYAEILEHSFLRGLTDGTLPRTAFRHFVEQDSLYLRDYARALALCGARAPEIESVQAFLGDAAGAIAAEQEMLAGFGAELGEEPLSQEVLPTTRAYTSYLLAAAYGGSYAEAVAAVLPCYWIYARVGEQLLAKSSPDPLYARWIAVYGDESFQEIVRRVVALTDELAEQVSAAERERMRERFTVASRYEWMFWNAAWIGERWPV